MTVQDPFLNCQICFSCSSKNSLWVRISSRKRKIPVRAVNKKKLGFILTIPLHYSFEGKVVVVVT